MESKTPFLSFSFIRNLPKDSSISVQIRPLEAKDLTEVSLLLAKNLPERHPYWIGNGLTSSELYPFLHIKMDVFLSEGFSIVAIHNQKIIGFVGAYDFACIKINDFYDKLWEKYPLLKKKYQPFGKKENDLIDFQKPKERGNAIMINSLVVDGDYEGKGLGYILMDFVNYHPKVKEYSKFLVKFSAKASEVIGIKLGFQIVRKNKWEDYVNDDNDEETWKNLPEKLKEKGLSADNDGIALAVLKK